MNVFLITAPFQMLNAIEAIHHFTFINNALIILKTMSFSEMHYEKLIKRDDWASVKYIDFRYRVPAYDFGATRPRDLYERLLEWYQTVDQALKRTRLDRMAKSLGSVENLILGSYRSDLDLHFRHFANRVACENVYVIDVGTNTIDFERQIEETRASAGVHEIGKKGLVKKIRRTLRERFVEWDSCGLKTVTFFTCYVCDGAESSRIVKNEYNYLKSMIHNAAPSNRVMFLGESLVVDEIVPLNSYIRYLKKIKAYFDTADLVYVPHPRESEKDLQMIRTGVGLNIERYEVPIEYALATGGKRPKCVASFFSSALQNCSIIFGENLAIKSFRLQNEDLLKGEDMIGRIYSYFASDKTRNIQIIDSF